jgi:hypothetical protein
MSWRNEWMAFYNYHTNTPIYFDGRFEVRMLKKGLWQLNELTEQRTYEVIGRFKYKSQAQSYANSLY